MLCGHMTPSPHLFLSLSFALYCISDASGRVQAEKAIMALHGKHTMPSMTNTIQLSYAKGEESEAERPDAKLFIGMLARTATEEDVRALVSPFGQVLSMSWTMLYSPCLPPPPSAPPLSKLSQRVGVKRSLTARVAL